MKTAIIFLSCIFLLINANNYSQILPVDKLVPDVNGKLFGASVSIDGNYAIIGCPYDNTNGQVSGSAYLYDIAEKSLVKIIGSDVNADDLFGLSVAIDGQTLIVGAPHSGTYWEGAIYIFKRQSNGVWNQDTTIKQTVYNEQFGSSVSISSPRIMVGTVQPVVYIYKYTDDYWAKDTAITINDPNLSGAAGKVCIYNDLAAASDSRNNELGLDVGAVFIYEYVGDTAWVFRQKLLPDSSKSTRDYFGSSLSMDGNSLVVGAPHHMDLQSLQPSGAVYIFEREDSLYEYTTHLSKSYSLPNDRFGEAVDISNNFLLVGAPGANETFLFKKSISAWDTLPDTLKASDGFWTDQFGGSVSLSGNYALIGASNHTGTATANSGAAYLFSGFITSLEEVIAEIPAKFSLCQNYPNPFNPTTKISWQSPVGSWQTLKVYDVLGNEVKTLVNKEMEAGYYSVDFNASELPSGVYFYQLKAENYVETKKMLLLK